MKRMILVALCAGCTFGVDGDTTDLVDQGGIRVRPNTLTLDNGTETVVREGLRFTNAADWLSGEAPHMLLRFDYQGHEIELESLQIERLTIAGGRALLRVDGAPQVVSVRTDMEEAVPEFYTETVQLSFAFRVDNSTVQTTMSIQADFHCPPFDTTPAEVEEIATLE